MSHGNTCFSAVYRWKAAIKARMPCTNSSIVRDCSHSSSTEENLPTDMFQAKLLLLLSLTLFQAHSAPHFKEMEDGKRFLSKRSPRVHEIAALKISENMNTKHFGATIIFFDYTPKANLKTWLHIEIQNYRVYELIGMIVKGNAP